jgi:hypothetical protein
MRSGKSETLSLPPMADVARGADGHKLEGLLSAANRTKVRYVPEWSTSNLAAPNNEHGKAPARSGLGL